MTHGMIRSDHSEAGALSLPRREPSRLPRLLAIASPIALLIAVAFVVPLWVPTLPRPVRRALTEAMLRSVLGTYSALFLMAVVGPPVFGWLLARSWRKLVARPAIERGFLLAIACFSSLVMLELGAAVCGAWMHRFPRLPTDFEPAPAEEFRIVVLGGSSALGEPYRPWLSVGQIVAWQLQQAIKGRHFECEILANLGESLEMQHRKLAGIKRRPHAVIIYSGHNEFAARFEEEREGWADEAPGYWLPRQAYRATLKSAFCTLVYEVISKNRLDTPPPLAGRHHLIDPPQCSPTESAAILSDFRRRLEALVSYCDQIGALPILIVPPANEAGFEPSRSTLPLSVPEAERRRLVEDVHGARAVEYHNPSNAAAIYSDIIKQHPRFAEAHFRLARLLETRGEMTNAESHYLAALDNDGLPVRCQAPFRAAYVEVASRHPRSVLIDGRRELKAASRDGLLGDDVIQDTHHPTIGGYVALASAVLRELARIKGFEDARSLDLPLDPAACALHFAMDADKWATMCERTSVHYKRVAGYRYDPVERLAKSRRYAEAAKLIRAGTAAEDLGLPGIGARAAAAKSNGKAFGRRPMSAARGRSTERTVNSHEPRELRSPHSFVDLFDLPVLEVDHCPAAEEPDDGDELIPLGSPDNLADHARQRAGHDSHGRTDGYRVFRRNRQPRAEHGVDLAQVANQGLLIVHLDHVHQASGAQGCQPGIEVTFQEHVARKERNDRSELPSLGRSRLFQYLGEIVNELLIS
jgi:hypothetical protein